MAVLHIVLDPHERLMMPNIAEMNAQLELRIARLSIPDDLEGRDIYEIARKLAALLLEQLL